MGYKQPSSGLPFKQMGSSPAKQIKEVKGTSIFGKSPKDFAVDVAKNVTGYNAVKGIYDKISGSKTKLTNNKSDKNSVSKGASEAAQGLVEGGKMGLMKKKGKPVEKKYMKVKKDIKMKPPYKKQVGPRAESSPTPYASPAKQTKKPVGPVATEKKTSVKEHNVKARMHNVMEIKDRETSPSSRRPKPQKIQMFEPVEAKPLKPMMKKIMRIGRGTTIN